MAKLVLLGIAAVVAAAVAIAIARAGRRGTSTDELAALREVANRSTAIVVATPTGEMNGAAASDNSPANTLVTVEVDRVLKGEVADRMIRVRQPGFFRDVSTIPADQPLLRSRRQYVVFLRTAGDAWTIVGGGYYERVSGTYERRSGNERLPSKLTADELQRTIDGRVR